MQPTKNCADSWTASSLRDRSSWIVRPNISSPAPQLTCTTDSLNSGAAFGDNSRAPGLQSKDPRAAQQDHSTQHIIREDIRRAMVSPPFLVSVRLADTLDVTSTTTSN